MFSTKGVNVYLKWISIFYVFFPTILDMIWIHVTILKNLIIEIGNYVKWVWTMVTL